MNEPAMLQEAADFSLVLGGPLFQLFRRAHLSGDAMELLKRRIVLITTIAWLPLLILSWLSGHVLASVALPFMHDIETQIRFLIALPTLIAAELIVHLRLRPVVQAFVKRNIVVAEEMPKFRTAINSAKRWRDSIPLELALLIFVCTVGHWLWQSQIALGTSSWYATPEQKTKHGTPLLGDVCQSSPIPAGVFQWHQSQIARHLLATLKTARISDDQYEGQCGERTDSGMRHQLLRRGTLFHLTLDRLTQFSNRWVQSIQQLQQIVPTPAGPGR